MLWFGKYITERKKSRKMCYVLKYIFHIFIVFALQFVVCISYHRSSKMAMELHFIFQFCISFTRISCVGIAEWQKCLLCNRLALCLKPLSVTLLKCFQLTSYQLQCSLNQIWYTGDAKAILTKMCLSFTRTSGRLKLFR